jgi:hypothetical protein
MVISNFAVISVAFLPAETNSPLVVYTDTPLPDPITSQLLKAVSRRDTEEVEARSAMKLLQLALTGSLGILRQLGRESPVKELFRFFADKGYNHRGIVTLCGSIVKR